ncbi:MAG: amino acid permease [Nitrospirota bacterium]
MGRKTVSRKEAVSGRAAMPRPTLSTTDAVSMIIGMVIGAGIFKTPSLVALNSGSEGAALTAWLLGGVLSFIGALCYAELTSTYPHAGGDYYYLRRAFGNSTAFLFAWARIMVIQTGSIALVAFLIGDYASGVARLGPYSSSVYAALIIAGLTALNVAGIQQGKRVQNVLTAAIMGGLVSVVALGLATAPAALPRGAPPVESSPVLGKAMIFVLLTYGGWNEAAYLSSELRGAKRTMVRVLFYGIGIITVLYVGINFIFMRVLGVAGTAASETVAADFMRYLAGESGAHFISLLVIVAALSTGNAATITGARSAYALGRDFSLFRFLGQWHERSGTPANALLLQGAIALALVLMGTGTRSGFTTMVEYTAPVFWFFFLLVGIALFVLRRKDPALARPFRVPLYPLTPIIFCAFCAYMLRASLAYTGIGALAGVAVLVSGLPLLLVARSHEKTSDRKGGPE